MKKYFYANIKCMPVRCILLRPVNMQPFTQKPNSWTYDLVEVSVHNLESSQTWGFRIQCLHFRPFLKHFCSVGGGGGAKSVYRNSVRKTLKAVVPITSNKNSPQYITKIECIRKRRVEIFVGISISMFVYWDRGARGGENTTKNYIKNVIIYRIIHSDEDVGCYQCTVTFMHYTVNTPNMCSTKK